MTSTKGTLLASPGYANPPLVEGEASSLPEPAITTGVLGGRWAERNSLQRTPGGCGWSTIDRRGWGTFRVGVRVRVALRGRGEGVVHKSVPER